MDKLDFLTDDERRIVGEAHEQAEQFVRNSDAYQLRVVIIKLVAALTGVEPELPYAADDPLPGTRINRAK